MSDGLIVPTGIPQFTGNLGGLEKQSKSLAADAKLFRDSGAAVHSSFQGLSACYKAPEADKLFATTAPVATKSDGFADDLEKVSSALDAYASEVRPLADKLATLKEQAIAFVASVEDDDDWRKDKKKTDRNDELWHSVNATVDAFHAAERTCHDKIVALVGGTSLIADDGSHKSNMYGYKASDLDRAEETPWGSMAEREYTGLAWLRHQVKSYVWDGFVMDGIVGTAKGVATLFGSEGWGKAGEAWTGLAKLATGVVITMSPLSGAYWMASDDQLPGWFRESRTTMKQGGKAFVAYDQWGKNPARAAGGVTFNVLTAITGGAGAAAKGGAVAKTFAAAGKVGRLIDPMTYVGKAGKFAFVKVGDLMSSLKTLNPGTSLRIAGETFRLADEASAAKLAERPAGLPDEAAPLVDNKGRPVYLNPKTGELFDEHGKVKQPAESVPKEGSAAERAAEHARAPQPDRALVGAGARAGSDVTASAGRAIDNLPGSAAHHPPGGAASHQPGGGSADDLGRRPTNGHDDPTQRSHEGSSQPHNDGPSERPGNDAPHEPEHGTPGREEHGTPAHGDRDGHAAHDGPEGHGPKSGWGGAGWIEVPKNAEDLAVHNAAAKVYEEIRGTPNSYDLPKIAEHTGVDRSVLKQVKTHLFRSQHEVALGPGDVRRGAFTPYPHIAELWKGATEGTLSKAQKTQFRHLMAHEYVESQLMKAGMPYISPNPGAWVPDGPGAWRKANFSPNNALNFGAHDVAPKEIGGSLRHWKRSMGLKIPSVIIARDLSNLDDVVKAAIEELNKKGWSLK
ncbi:hypothetical protein [Streptomyces netropsis]|uniref:Uncharacterized protein n=1 Tax=Streptomyces netropsis TaxID=55404 RepID=A0A7W7L9T4_STRNE|nr:hypothetical protein [Streptomyces netropsis]MBB4886027.1 hypothetical protein [Streptomyces netropsis]GGR17148.1 hypothetical protein GCM10010219_22630 [Streptomyces netropsis]